MFVPIIISFLLSIFSTAVMSYITMATPIGPWIAPTVVLLAMIIGMLLRQSVHGRSTVYITSAASIGGILATGFGFSFPTIYFLEPELFMAWMAKPFYFASYITGMACAAGSFGLLLANMLEKPLIVRQKLAFPIGQLVHKMIVAGNQIRKAYELMVGFLGTTIFCLLQDGVRYCGGIIPKSFTLLNSMQMGALHIPLIRFDMWPMVWAIGFITGHVIAVPLGVGAALKIFFADPVNRLFFKHLTSVEFIFVLCSGMALFGFLNSLASVPKLIKQLMGYFNTSSLKKTTINSWFAAVSLSQIIESGCLLAITCSILTLFDFSFAQQLYLLLFTGLFTYQMAIIAGKWGIAPLGRFATFVMWPAMFMFNLSLTHIVLVATFVEVCGGVAVDMLFNRKVGRLMSLDGKIIKRYQYFGLLISALSVGLFFWLLINSCTLGSAQLFAYKAQSRRLLINALTNGAQFNYYVMALGLLLSFILKKIKINPMLVLGGLLMPLNLSIGLVFGGMLSLLTKQKQEWEPFWSGVFAANSVWMIIKAIL